MKTRQGRPVQYTDDLIERAVSELRRETGAWPSIRAVKESLGGGTDKRIKAVLDRLKADAGDGRENRAGPNATAAPAADPAAILGMLGSDALTSQVLTVLQSCLAGLAEVAQSHVDARIAASHEANAAAVERRVAEAVEAAMAEERRERKALELKLSEIEIGQRLNREVLSSVAGDLNRVVKPMGRIVRSIDELVRFLPSAAAPEPFDGEFSAHASGAEPSLPRRSGGTEEPMADASPAACGTPPAGAASGRRINPIGGDDQTAMIPSRAPGSRSSSGEEGQGARRGEVPRGTGEALPCPAPASPGGPTSAAMGLAVPSPDVPMGRPGWAAGATVYGRDAGLDPGPAGSSVPPGGGG